MKIVYLIIDLNEKINPVDALTFLQDLSDNLGIKQFLLFCSAPSYKLRPLDNKNYSLILNNAQTEKWKEISFQEDMQKGYDIFIDKVCEKQFLNEQQSLIYRFRSLEPELESMFEQKIPLLEIIEKIGIYDFLFFMRNFSLSENRFQYASWIRESLSLIPIDEYKKLVTETQNIQSKNDFGISVSKVQDMQLFDFSIDLNLNTIKVSISPLLGKTEEGLLKYLAASVNQLQDIYPNVSAYLDINFYVGFIRTAHEECFNIHDKFSEHKGLSLRGYSRYNWINYKQYQALGGDNMLTGIDELCVYKRKNGYCIELEKQSYENYAKLKKLFSPLLSKGEYMVYDQAIFDMPLMLNTVVSDSEFEIIDEVSSTKDEYKNLSLINKLSFVMMIKEMKKQFGEEAAEGLTNIEHHRCIRRFF